MPGSPIRSRNPAADRKKAWLSWRTGSQAFLMIFDLQKVVSAVTNFTNNPAGLPAFSVLIRGGESHE